MGTGGLKKQAGGWGVRKAGWGVKKAEGGVKKKGWGFKKRVGGEKNMFPKIGGVLGFDCFWGLKWVNNALQTFDFRRMRFFTLVE